MWVRDMADRVSGSWAGYGGYLGGGAGQGILPWCPFVCGPVKHAGEGG
jgi:hypothetical protein